MEVSDTLVRAARELLRWDQRMLASKARVGLATLRRFETGAPNIQAETISKIVAALQKAGVAFVGPDEGFKNVKAGILMSPASKPLPRPDPRVYKPRARQKPTAAKASTARKTAVRRNPGKPKT